MRKLDLLMIKSFIGPFILTTAVSNFILLIQYLLKYFDDFVGKNLGATVFAELLFYFSLNMLQVALPLGVLVASLMTFGNLGENFELTAIKSSGISLLRTLRPIFLFVVVLSIGAFFFNNYAIPAANLKAYSLLYDIKHTKPALDIKEGAFYNGIPDFSIKAKEKLPDGKTLLDVIIYDHTSGRGNTTIILADSSLMYTILDDRYLKLELYNGNYYLEQPKSRSDIDQFYRTKYYKMDLVFSLASFDLKRRKEELFQNNRQMKNISELTHDIDSFKTVIVKTKSNFIHNSNRYFEFHLKSKTGILNRIEQNKDTIQDDVMLKSSMLPIELFKKLFTQKKDSLILKKGTSILNDSISESRVVTLIEKSDSAEDEELTPVFTERNKLITQPKRPFRKLEYGMLMDSIQIDTMSFKFLENSMVKYKSQKAVLTNALNKARNVKVNIGSTKTRVYQLKKDQNLYTIEKYKKYAQALACILMFMIGAPLGAIIKKGGLGMPTIIAIIFFIVYYVFTSIGEKSAKEGAMNPYFAVWLSDLVLLPFGLFFLRQARIDARLFDPDFYNIWIEKLKLRFARKGKEV
jgi:lipopolysaccharide export system permease protein